MNVLNSSYFDPQQVSIAVGHIFESLAIGGLLIVGSMTRQAQKCAGESIGSLAKDFKSWPSLVQITTLTELSLAVLRPNATAYDFGNAVHVLCGRRPITDK